MSSWEELCPFLSSREKKIEVYLTGQCSVAEISDLIKNSNPFEDSLILTDPRLTVSLVLVGRPRAVTTHSEASLENSICLWEGAVCACAQSCLTLCDCSLPGSSVHGNFEARIPGCVAISYSRGSSPPRDGTHVSYISCFVRQVLYHCTTWQVLRSSRAGLE